MATNYVQAGEKIDWNNDSGSAVSSGDVVVVGGTDDGMICIASTDIANGSNGTLYTEGVFEVAKVSGAVIANGEFVMWDSSASEFDDNQATAASGDVMDGAIAWEDKGSGTTTIKIKLRGCPGALTA